MNELTSEEEQILNELSRANEHPEMGDQYREDDEVQRNIIAMLLTDYYFMVQAQSLVKPNYFRNEAHQMMCRVLFDFFDKYRKVPPKNLVLQEIEDQIANKKPEIKQYYRTEFHLVYDYYIPGVESRDYLLDRITNFAKTQSLKIAFHKSLDELKKRQTQDTWLNIHDILREALTLDRNFDQGLDYFQTFEERYARMSKKEEEQEIFTSAFDAIDAALLGGGLSRGEVGSWMGLPGTGKSLALVAAAMQNVNRGKRVLYISLEMDQDKIAERFDAQYANMTKQYEGIVTVNNLLEQKEIVFESLRDYISTYEDPRLLVIKQFPAGAMDIATFRAYLTQLKLRGFTPDLVILDYVGEMKDYPNMPTWESRNKIVRDLRGLAVEENICIMTAMQPDKKARQDSNENREFAVIDDANLADAYGQSRPLDALWSINQFQDEKDCGLARIFVVKHRHGKSRFTFHVEFDYRTLRMSQINQATYERRLKEYRNSKDVVARESAREALSKRKQTEEVDRILSRDDGIKDVGFDDE